MRIKIIPVLFMTLAIISMGMLANNPVLADPPADTVIFLGDDYCTGAERDLLLCFNVDTNKDFSVDYVVQIEPDIIPDRIDLSDPEAGDFDVEWPIPNNDGTVTFRYRAFVPPEADCNKVDTWNYFLQKISTSIADDLLSTEPPGAQLLLPGDSVNKCSDFIAGENDNLLKTNPSLNCSPGNEVIFSYTYTGNVSLGFGNESRVLTKSGCDSNVILAAGGDALPFHAAQSHSFPLGGSVDVVFNPPTFDRENELKSVTIDGVEIPQSEERAWICTRAPEGSAVGDDYIVNHPDLGLLLCIEPEQAGLEKQGCVVDANPRSYLFGGDVYTGR
jgi:hypothetical protein